MWIPFDLFGFHAMFGFRSICLDSVRVVWTLLDLFLIPFDLFGFLSLCLFTVRFVCISVTLFGFIRFLWHQRSLFVTDRMFNTKRTQKMTTLAETSQVSK
jgi:hypothetical protein